MTPNSSNHDQFAPELNLIQRLTSQSWKDIGFVLIPIALLAIAANKFVS